MGTARRGVRFMEEGIEWRLPGLLYAEDLVLCGESEEDLRLRVGLFVEVFYPAGSMVPSWVIASRFLAENREAELNPHHFFFTPIFPYFPVFPFLLTPYIIPHTV